MFRWCLGHVWVVPRSFLSGVSIMFSWCVGCFLWCFCYVLVVYLFVVLLMFCWRLACGLLVPRSQSWCVYERGTCMSIKLVHLARRRLKRQVALERIFFPKLFSWWHNDSS